MSYSNNPAADWDAHIRDEEYLESLLMGACEGSKKGFFRDPCLHNGDCILQDTDNIEKMINHCARLRHITRCLNKQYDDEIADIDREIQEMLEPIRTGII